MSTDFALQVQAYLQTLNTARMRQTYTRALADFHPWYVQTYGEELDTTLLPDEEAREWRHFLANVRRFSATIVTQCLAALKGLARGTACEGYEEGPLTRGAAERAGTGSPHRGRRG